MPSLDVPGSTDVPTLDNDCDTASDRESLSEPDIFETSTWGSDARSSISSRVSIFSRLQQPAQTGSTRLPHSENALALIGSWAATADPYEYNVPPFPVVVSGDSESSSHKHFRNHSTRLEQASPIQRWLADTDDSLHYRLSYGGQQ